MKLVKNCARVSVLALPLALAACGGGDDTPSETAEYTVTIYNITHNQPLSPAALVLHDGSFSGWRIGEPASSGLENLAESGSPTDFLAASSAVTAAGEGAIGPGASTSITLSGDPASSLTITMASMLVNTNDAFTGLAIGVENLEVGDYVEALAPVYDAGTEFNSELAGTIPGPADNGEGFNAERETRDQVTRHPGVVTQADAYAESVLDQSHRFDNSAARVRIERSL